MRRRSSELRGVETLRPEEKRSTARFSYKAKGEMSRGTSFILDFTVHPKAELQIAKARKEKTGIRGDSSALSGTRGQKTSVLSNRRRKAQLTHPRCLLTHRSASDKGKAAGTLFTRAAFPEGRARVHRGRKSMSGG